MILFSLPIYQCSVSLQLFRFPSCFSIFYGFQNTNLAHFLLNLNWSYFILWVLQTALSEYNEFQLFTADIQKYNGFLYIDLVYCNFAKLTFSFWASFCKLGISKVNNHVVRNMVNMWIKFKTIFSLRFFKIHMTI